MTEPFDDEYGDRLRRALHAEAEAVMPSAEGLERIRTQDNQAARARFGLLSYSAPWLRPLAAVTAALVVCVVAVSVTPALANFVQTGHFSPDSGSGNGARPRPAAVHTARSSRATPRARSRARRRARAHRPADAGKHVVNGGTCPPGRRHGQPVGHSDARLAGQTRAKPKVTCQPRPATRLRHRSPRTRPRRRRPRSPTTRRATPAQVRTGRREPEPVPLTGQPPPP